MTFENYKTQRTELMDAANALINEGKNEEAKTKMDEVKALDAKWDATAEALADLQALNDEVRTYNVQDFAGVKVEDGVATAKVIVDAKVDVSDEAETLLNSKEYETAWAKSMMNQATLEDRAIIEKVNAMTTINTGIVVPQSVTEHIMDLVEADYPFYAQTQKSHVKGSITILVGEESDDAAWYDELTPTEAGEDSVGGVTLSGNELARSVDISWKLQKQSVSGFLAYIEKKLAQKMGAGLGYGVMYGKGKPGAGETFKPEPLGVVTALKAEEETPQIIKYEDTISYSDFTGARAAIKVGSKGLKVYANNTTIFNQIANVKDATGRPMFATDPMTGNYKILGLTIEEDSSLKDGDILVGNADFYAVNIEESLGVLPENSNKNRSTNYSAYALVDGSPLTTKAFVLLTQGE